MPRGGAHRVVDIDDGQGADRVPLALHLVHLGDFFFERASRQRNPKGTFLVFAGLLAKARRATVLALVMAFDAVSRLVKRPLEVGAGVGEMEPDSMTMVLVFTPHRELDRAVDDFRNMGHQMKQVDFLWEPEEDALAMLGPPLGSQDRPGRVVTRELKLGGMIRLVFEPSSDV
jgi:hypothetical protein